jgi:sporulation protein YqfC
VRVEREKPAREACIYIEGTGRRLVVRGHRGILEYTQQVLRLRMQGAVLLVEGEGMTLESMDGEDVAVEGEISGVKILK